jgi:type II secretory pathway predicted ATPase ExeA
MNPAELAHFGLTQVPFSKQVDDGDLWLPPSKVTLIDQMAQALHHRQSILLDGEPGVGKTCVLRALRARLPEANYRLTYCHNASLGRRDFYRQVCMTLDLPLKATVASLFAEITRHVEDIASQRKHAILLIDEAHLLHQEVLDHLHILCNYDWDSKALLSLLLVGLPELRDRLHRKHQRSLNSRISQRFRVEEPDPEDTAHYLQHRLRLAGIDHDLFTEDAVAILHEAHRNLRDIGRFAVAAMQVAYAKKRRLVDRDAVLQAIRPDEV